MAVRGVARRLLQASARKESLQRIGRDTGVAKLVGGFRRGCETLHGISVLLGRLADRREARGFPGSSQALKPLYAIGRGKDFLDCVPLAIVQVRAPLCMSVGVG